MAAVGVTILGAVLSTALPALLSEILRRINKPEVRRAVSSLSEELHSIGVLVAAYHNRCDDTSLAWKDKIAQLGRLAYQIEDCVDSFKIKEIDSQLFATEIGTHKTSLQEQSNSIREYVSQNENQNLRRGGARGQHAGGILDQADGLVGMEEPLLDLQELVDDSVNKEKKPAEGKRPTVISIVGFGGLGKTCLAAEVYRQVEAEKRPGNPFPLCAFACATGRDKDEILKEILRELYRLGPGGSIVQAPPDANAKTLMKELRTHLKSTEGKERYFIVIDDLQDGELGDHVIRAFREAKEVDGIIIVTTTVLTFAKSCSSNDGHVYKMKPLDVRDSGILFNNQHNRRPPPDETELNSMGIGKECEGVPLALISMAGFWEGDASRCKEAWSKFYDPVEGYKLARIQGVLDRSYYSLPSSHVQTGLLYFSMFPRGYHIRRGSLIRRWLAEGPEVGCGNHTDNRHAAERSLKTLIDWNAIWPTQVSINEDQDAKACRPPGVMLGYISSKSMPEGFLIVPSNQPNGAQLIRRLSLQTGDGEVLKNGDVSRLRTLVVFRSENNGRADALCFDKCRLLRVLDLEACCSPEKIHLRQICKQLKLLKYLSLHAGIIGHVHKEIEEFKYLETLDLGKRETVVKVHVNVMKLPFLKHILGKFQLMKSTELNLFPERFKGENLETLAGFVTCTGKGFPSLMHNMSKLRKVKIFFDTNARVQSLIPCLAKPITEFIDASADPNGADERRSLSVNFQNCVPLLLDNEQETQAKKDGLKIFSLKLRGSGELKEFPAFGANLAGITKLCLSWTTLVLSFTEVKTSVASKKEKWFPTFMDVLSKLEGLMYLKLVADDIKVDFNKNPTPGRQPQELVIKPGHFTRLKRMCLMAKNSLPKITIEADALNNLVSLHLICEGLGVPAMVICEPTAKPNPPAHKIPPLGNLKEILLHAEVKTKKAWHEAARKHLNRPQVLFIEDPWPTKTSIL